MVGVEGVIMVAGLIGVLLPVTAFDAEPGVVRVRRATVESRKKMRFMLLSYCGSGEEVEWIVKRLFKSTNEWCRKLEYCSGVRVSRI